jgi:hypothetical protein
MKKEYKKNPEKRIKRIEWKLIENERIRNAIKEDVRKIQKNLIFRTRKISYQKFVLNKLKNK